MTTDAATASWRERWFGGLTVKVLGGVLAVSAINGMRRAIGSPDLLDSPLDWLLDASIEVLVTFVSALLIVVVVIAAFNHLGWRGWRLYAICAGTTVVVCAMSLVLSVAWFLYVWPDPDLVSMSQSELVERTLAAWSREGPLFLILGLLFTTVWIYLRQHAESLTAMRTLELDLAQRAQQMAEARLAVLHAQIEPHFLFNTLANVKRLFQIDPLAGDRMLDSLMRYLEMALPEMRDKESTLGRELALAEAFLHVHKIRMGKRLDFGFDVSDTLRSVPMPPMMLLTLVENAIKHGVGPQPEGGRIDISASEESGSLAVRVADSGGGFSKTIGGGTGLANLRARLSALFGAGGRVSFRQNDPSGVIATITIPRPDAHIGVPAG